MSPWVHFPGAKRVLLQEALATVNGSPTVFSIDNVKNMRRSANGDYRLLGIELEGTYQVDTTTPAIDMHDVRWHSPIDVNIEGWPEAAYSQARGDAVRWLNIATYGKIMGADFAVATSQTNATGRTSLMLPFAGVIGADPWDSAPHCSMVQSLSVGRLDSIFTGVTVDSLTMSAWCWVAPYHKTTVGRAFQFKSFPAPSDLEMKIPSADNVHLAFATDTDDAFTRADLINQIKIGGNPILEGQIRVGELAREFNRAMLNDGANAGAGIAISETTPEMLPFLFSGMGLGRSLTPTKALPGVGGSVITAAQDLGGTIHYHYLISTDLAPNPEAYLDAAGLRRGVPTPLHRSAGNVPGIPVRIQRAA